MISIDLCLKSDGKVKKTDLITPANSPKTMCLKHFQHRLHTAHCLQHCLASLPLPSPCHYMNSDTAMYVENQH